MKPHDHDETVRRLSNFSKMQDWNDGTYGLELNLNQIIKMLRLDPGEMDHSREGIDGHKWFELGFGWAREILELNDLGIVHLSRAQSHTYVLVRLVGRWAID